jgi:RNA polymerase sigma-70 factor (ECF subfamily)
MTVNESVIVGRILPWSTAGEVDWESAYAEAMPRVYNFFRYRVGPGAEAEDLTAATFERAWQARHRYRRDLGGFSTWLFTIARNLAVDHYRKRRDHVPLEAAQHVAGGATPEELAIARSDRERLGRMLERLPERDRELVAFKYGAEMTNRSIARATGLSESNVGTILHRTVNTLRAEWNAEGESR